MVFVHLNKMEQSIESGGREYLNPGSYNVKLTLTRGTTQTANIYMVRPQLLFLK